MLWSRINLWLGIVSLMLGWSMWVQPAPTASCCCPGASVSSSTCDCQPQLCQCTPSDRDRKLTLLPVPVAALLPGTRAPQPTRPLVVVEACSYQAPRLAVPRQIEVQPRAPPYVLA